MMKLLSYDQVCDRTSLSRSQISKLIRVDQFPPPCDLGARVGFVESEVTRWIKARIKDRDERGDEIRAERSRRGTEAVLKRWVRAREARTSPERRRGEQ